jgi:hypothetical protein
MKFNSVKDLIKNIKNLKSNGHYFDLVNASTIISQSKKEIEDLQKSVRDQLDGLKYQKSIKNDQLRKTSIQIDREMKRKKMTSIKVSLLLLIIYFLLVQNIILPFIEVCLSCFLLIIIIYSYLSRKSQLYNLKFFENFFWTPFSKKDIDISFDTEDNRIFLKNYILNITILITYSYLIAYSLFSISLFYGLFIKGMNMDALIFFIIYIGLPTFPLLRNTHLSDCKIERENLKKEIDILKEKISVCENSL